MSDNPTIRDIFSDLSAPPLSDADPVRRAQIQMKQPLPRRFYKDVTIGASGDEFAILLDGRPVKTPGRRPLAVPTRAAAELLAREWQDQKPEGGFARCHTERDDAVHAGRCRTDRQAQTLQQQLLPAIPTGAGPDEQPEHGEWSKDPENKQGNQQTR